MKSGFQRVTTSLMRLLLVVLLLMVALVFAIIQGGFVLWFVFFMLLPFTLYSAMLFLTPLSGMTIERKVSSKKVEQGQSVQVTVTLRRKTYIPLFFLVAQEVEMTGAFTNIDQQELRKIIPIGFKRSMSWTYNIPSMQRGKHELNGVQLTITDFLGWVQKTKDIPLQTTIIVFPKIESMTYEKVVSHDQNQLGMTTRQQHQQSTMVSSVRDYNPGDRMSWIHWKSFAKTGELYTKEFEQQQGEEACVIMDGLKGLHFEGQVSLVASLLTAVCKQHEKVSFLSAGEARVSFEQVQSEKELQEVLYHLATVQHSSFNPSIQYVQDAMLTKANAIIFITSLLTAEWIEVFARLTKKNNSITVYVVRSRNQKVFDEELAIEQHATARGIVVHAVEEGNFSTFNKEVRS